MSLQEIQIYVIAVGAGFVAPLFLARRVAGANWLAIALAYLVWPLVLYRLLAGGWSVRHEEMMWTMGFTLMSSWLAVPVIALGIHSFTRAPRGPAKTD